MAPLQPGSPAEPIPGIRVEDGRRAVVFYKVTCPTCQLAAVPMERIYRAEPEAFTAVGQDPPDRLEEFGRTFRTTFPPVADTPPYPLSDAYGIRTVPTLFVLEEGRVADVVESWDRDGWNLAATRLTGSSVSEEGDGLPPFRPG